MCLCLYISMHTHACEVCIHSIFFMSVHVQISMCKSAMCACVCDSLCMCMYTCVLYRVIEILKPNDIMQVLIFALFDRI